MARGFPAPLPLLYFRYPRMTPCSFPVATPMVTGAHHAGALSTLTAVHLSPRLGIRAASLLASLRGFPAEYVRLARGSKWRPLGPLQSTNVEQ